MISYVLGSNVTSVTARAIAEKIEAEQGVRCRYTNRPRMAYVGKFVRYGNLEDCPGECLNQASCVRGAADKLGALLCLARNYVGCPRIIENARYLDVAPMPMVFRKIVRHSGNDNPYILKNSGERIDRSRANQYDYAIQWIDKDEEYRVHVFKDKWIRVQRKEAQLDGRPRNMDIRSTCRGWMLRELAEPPQPLTRIGIRSIQALCLDFGAVDVVRDRATQCLYVIEVNTGPGLTEKGVARYVKRFTAWDRGEEC